MWSFNKMWIFVSCQEKPSGGCLIFLIFPPAWWLGISDCILVVDSLHWVCMSWGYLQGQGYCNVTCRPGPGDLCPSNTSYQDPLSRFNKGQASSSSSVPANPIRKRRPALNLCILIFDKEIINKYISVLPNGSLKQVGPLWKWQGRLIIKQF